MFTVSGMKPTDSSTECITVTYQGTLDAAVRLYGSLTAGDGLDDYLDLTVRRGSGGVFGDCTGFTLDNTIESGGTVADFDATHTSYATGAGVWDPSSTPESKTYRITVELDAAAPNAEQGESVTSFTFTWEIQN